MEEGRKPLDAREVQPVLDKYCVGCHGVNGDGKGPAAAYLDPRPRKLASGRYKIRTTRSGALPVSSS